MTPERKRGSQAPKGKSRARRETSAGGVVFRPSDRNDVQLKTDVGTPLYLLICDTYGKWGFPKGHVERGERPDTAALREVMEEAGLRAVIVLGSIASIEWFFRLHGDLIHKRCQYFLMETTAAHTKPQKSEGISECRWVTADEAHALISYKNAREVLQRAHEMVVARSVVAAPATAGRAG